ncbi:MAG: acetyl-CoA C-acyltransferase, partial [Acidobacteriota bacterium]
MARSKHPPLVLSGAVRTPIGKFGGALASLSAADLGAAAAKACLERSGCAPERVDQAIFGHGRQAGGGPNTARQIGYRAGLPVSRPAFTVNQACGSGLQAVLSA